MLGISGCSPADDGKTASNATQSSEPAPTSEAPSPGVRAIQVKGLIDDERYDEAETLLTSLLAEYPGDPTLTSDLVVVYRKTGRAAEAFRLLQQGLARDPNNHLYNVNMGRSYADQGEFEQALEHLNRALEIKPAVAPVYELRGICLMELNRWSEARTAFQAALSYDGRLPVSLVNLAFFEANTGNWDAVIDHTGRAIAINAGIGRAYLLRGWALAERGEFDEAERSLERAAELDPGDQQVAAIRARVAQMRSAAQ
jgi:Flp pilus assembly protein TadD